MARRRIKKRTQVAPNASKKGAQPSASIPRSMVIRVNASEVGPSVTQLVRDMRLVMSPHTAARLKERRSNKLRDYITMAGPLGVSHMLLFSKSDKGNTNLRLCTTPRGPTLSFRVEKYSLCKDVQASLKRPRGKEEDDYLNPPLVRCSVNL
jgi:ribosome biogenesis protein SSF1/2